jgi:hypothetical protein
MICDMAERKRVKMLTTREVGERLDVNPGQVRGWCISGVFPNATRQETPRGPIWYIPDSDLQGFRRRGPGRPSKVDAAGRSPRSKRKAPPSALSKSTMSLAKNQTMKKGRKKPAK